MANEIISYLDMCQKEGVSLQRGMNFGIGVSYSVILMSLRRNAPYRDRIEDNGSVLIYEGHDLPRTAENPRPKLVDQPEYTTSGALSENGKFHRAAQDFKNSLRSPEEVKVYEKIKQGIWSFNGLFHLVDSWKERDESRYVFKFKLIVVEDDTNHPKVTSAIATEHPRVIPTHVKVQVWKRDRGKCVICGAVNDLHFDHIIPYSKGGTSLSADNIQILCVRHNLEKSAKIE